MAAFSFSFPRPMSFPASPFCPALFLAACIITTAAPRSGAAEFTVTAVVDSGPGSLRQAILDANAAPGSDTVKFAIVGAGITPSLSLTGSLPEITGTLALDGASQNGAALVELKSAGMPAGASLLTVSAGGCSIKNLRLLSTSADTVALTLHAGNGGIVEGLMVGITMTNQTFPTARHGIVVESDDNTIRACEVGGEISGDGIRITGSRNRVTATHVGAPWSSSQRSNVMLGIHLIGGAENVIGVVGSVVPGNQFPEDRNYILENTLGGIYVEGGVGHRILGNECSRNGMLPFFDGFGIRIGGGADGVVIDGAGIEGVGPSNVEIAGPAGNVRIANLSSFGGGNGIRVGNAVSGVVIEDCYIINAANPGNRFGAGIHLAGGDVPSGPILIRDNVIEDSLIGVLVASGMGEVTIGTRGDSSSPYSNRISGNMEGGIVVRDPSARVRISENVLSNEGRYGANAFLLNLQPAGEPDETATPNDPLDADSGPNGLQNKPVLTTLVMQPDGIVQISGSLSSKPLTTYTMEAVASGRAWLGSATVTTDADGVAAFTFPGTGCQSGWAVVLTATSPDGETSELSNDAICPAAAPEFPLLANQTSLSLPETSPAVDSAFTILRQPGVSGAFTATLTLIPGFARDTTNTAPRPAMRYRFKPEDTWTDLQWGSVLNIAFAEGVDQRSIRLQAKDDTSWDPTNKESQLTLVQTGLATKQIPVRFPDNDPPPVLVLKQIARPGFPAESGFLESYGSTGFALTADRAITANVEFAVSINTGKSAAVGGQDFTLEGSRAILAESRLQTGTGLRIAATNDTVVEADETLVLDVVSLTAGVVFRSEVSTVIHDDDFYLLSVGNAAVDEGNTGSATLGFPVTLNQASATDIAFIWTITSGGAVAGSDFTGSSGMATIPAGTTSILMPISVQGDADIESDEDFILTISAPAESAVRIAQATATGTILNDDNPAVSLADATVSEVAGSVTVTATLSEATPFSTSVNYTIVDGSAGRPGDFTGAASGVLDFPAGAISASLSVGIVDDSVVEADETFSIQLGSPVNLVLADGAAVVTILDNDLPAMGALASQTVTEGDEGFQDVTVTLTLNAAGTQESSVDWSVAPESTAVTPASGKAVFAPGSTTASVTLTVPGNRTPHPTRGVDLLFSNPFHLTLTGPRATALTVLDNDQLSITGRGFSINEGSEGSTAAAFRISIPSVLDVPVSVDYATAEGSALAGGDFSAASGTATIPAGATEATIPIAITVDSVYEENESFRLLLSNPLNATLAVTDLDGTILNDDGQPSLSVGPSVVTSSPGVTGQAWLEVKLGTDSPARSVPVSYQVNTRDGTVIGGTHYTPIAGGVLTFQPGRAAEWIAVTTHGGEGGGTTGGQFFVDFVPVKGPASTVTATVTIEPLRILNFSRLALGFYYLQFPAGKGQNYIVQEAESLAGPWTDHSSILLGSGSPVFQAVASTGSRAYFRVMSYSNPPSSPANLKP